MKMEKSNKPLSGEQLFRKILELEERHAHLQQEMSKHILSPKPDHQISNLISCFRSVNKDHGGVMELTETQYLNILQSMGQAIHIYDCKHRIIFWNRAAENFYGFTAVEAIGKIPEDLIVEPKDFAFANDLIERTVKGESMSGEFVVKNKRGEKLRIIATNTPLRDENSKLLGAMCISSDARPYQVMNPEQCISKTDSLQPLHTSVASKISNLGKMKMNTGDKYRDVQSEASTLQGHIGLFPFGVFFSTGTKEPFIGHIGYESEIKPRICKILSSKTEEWMGKNRTVSFDTRCGGGRFGWYRIDVNHKYEPGPQMISSCSAKQNRQLCKSTSNKMEITRMWFFTLHFDSKNSLSSGGMSIKNGNAIIKFKSRDTDSLDYEIFWEDLIIKQQIGQGSSGTVYHALWYGSDVAVKLFAYEEFEYDAILSFRQEVSIMKRLRHPNILLYMGAVTSPHHLCIVTEFLPRGSLFRILQRNSTRLDWRRQLHMAIDIARGMNYLHQCNPPIVHRDLKSSNLLVDKNWNVKIGDFGLSRIKYQAYLKTNTGKGTVLQFRLPFVPNIRQEVLMGLSVYTNFFILQSSFCGIRKVKNAK